jgi:hypothetical protein
VLYGVGAFSLPQAGGSYVTDSTRASKYATRRRREPDGTGASIDPELEWRAVAESLLDGEAR